MEKRLFVAGLPFAFTDRELTDLFSEFGTVVSASIIMDRETGKSKGFGFVELETKEAAQSAITKLNDSQVGDRKIIVNLARPREERPRGNFGGDNRRFGGRDNSRNGNSKGGGYRRGGRSY